MEKKLSTWQKVDKTVCLLPAILIAIAIILGLTIPQSFGNAASKALSFMTTYFGWFYALGCLVLLVFCLWIGLSKHGKIKLGGKDAKPEMSFFSWFAITLTSGMAAGIVFYGVAEPLEYFTNPPIFTGWEAGSPAAAEGALKYVFMHWCLHPYALYTSAGICFALLIWNAKKKFTISTGLYPLIGEKVNGVPGKLVNALMVFATLGCVGTSFGIVTQQLSAGINYVFNTNFSPTSLAIFVIATMTFFFILSACTGVHKGIKYVSKANMYIFFALMLWAFLFGGTLFIINNTTTSIGQYLALLIPQSFYLEPAYQSGWVGGWTIFYWAWWLSLCPIVGLFLIKLAKGRTLRQFVLVNMVAPAIFAFAWFGIFGSSSIAMEMSNTGLGAEIAENGIAIALFAYMKNLPLAPVLYILTFAAIVFSLVTLAESMVLTVADMTTKEEVLVQLEKEGKGSPRPLKIFWGVLMGLIAFTLLYSGGLTALQTSVVICGFPLLFLMLFMAYGGVKFLRNRKEYDLTMEQEEKTAPEKDEQTSDAATV
ncbi:MAG: BCCT family transporter [Bacillota bacterium]|nr:BCCT family transporter [Bacillota bacterium]